VLVQVKNKHERSSPVRPPGVEKTSRLCSRDPVASGVKCGPHDGMNNKMKSLSYGPPWAHYLGGYQDRLLGGPLGLPGLRCTAPNGVKHKDYRGEVLG
jgi:hypothetical protein